MRRAWIGVGVLLLLVVWSPVAAGFSSGVNPAGSNGPGKALSSWSSITVGAHTIKDVTIGVNLLANTAYSWTAGLRMAGGSFEHHVRWALCAQESIYPSCTGNTAVSSMSTYRWFAGAADWQDIKFITGTARGYTVSIHIVNWGDVARTFEYTFWNKVIDSTTGRRVRGPIAEAYGTSFAQGPTPLRWVYQTPQLTENTVYVFELGLQNKVGADAQQASWLFRCYRSSGDPITPGLLGAASRHIEFWELDMVWINLMVFTSAKGAYCNLFIGSWDSGAHSTYYYLRWYSGGRISRTTVYNGEAGTCLDIGPGLARQIPVVSLPGPRNYVAWSRVVLAGAQGQNDFDHKTAWYVAVGYPFPTDTAMREGYKVRYWTSFSPYDPWVEGTAAFRTIQDTVSMFLQIYNADTTTHRYCYAGVVYSWDWSGV